MSEEDMESTGGLRGDERRLSPDIQTLILAEVRQVRDAVGKLENRLTEYERDLVAFKLDTTKQLATLGVKASVFGALPSLIAGVVALIWWIVTRRP